MLWNLIEYYFWGFFCSQQWKKGKENEQGYFTLRALESSKLLTAFQEGLELKGNDFFFLISAGAL